MEPNVVFTPAQIDDARHPPDTRAKPRVRLLNGLAENPNAVADSVDWSRLTFTLDDKKRHAVFGDPADNGAGLPDEDGYQSDKLLEAIIEKYPPAPKSEPSAPSL